jgi:ribosomal protein S18 acetylase RimI-like enzyme
MDVVMQQAYGVASFRVSIERFVAVQPDGLVVVEDDGEVVGTGCCIAYPEGGFGWVGLVATAPGYQRRGIATAITDVLAEVLASHGCASVLDASLAGGPVYERMGFVDHGPTKVMAFAGEAPASGSNSDPLTTGDFDDVVEFDALRFGSPRAALLAKVIEQHPGRVLVSRRKGRVAGYLVAQEGTLGPVLADDSDCLSALVTDSLGLDWLSPPRITLPPESAHVGTLLTLGFEVRRELRHMRRGIGSLPGRRDCIAGQVSLGEG